MSRVLHALSVVACAASAAVASGAEDHSAHQHHQAQPAAAESEHADHVRPAQPAADAPTESELRHVPPPPPQRPMHDMSNQEMIEVMQMDDAARFGRVSLDEFEWRSGDGADEWAWDGEAWYGSDYNKLWLKSEGERIEGDSAGRAELLWDRIVSRWWSLQAGARHDFGAGPARSWLAFGLQGLAPYWFEVEATVYAGEEGRTAARFSAEYELLVMQRLVLQPEIELTSYGKEDPRNGIGSGLAETQVGLRLRYELRRELAPYIGVAWARSHGGTADLARAAGHDTSALQFVAGLRIWF